MSAVQKKNIKNVSASDSDTNKEIELKERIVNNDKPVCYFCSKNGNHNRNFLERKWARKKYILKRKQCEVSDDIHIVTYDNFDYTLETFLECKEYVNHILEVALSMVLTLTFLHKENKFHYNITPNVIAVVKNRSTQKYEIKFLDFFLSRDNRRDHVVPIFNYFEQNDFSAPELIHFREGNLKEIDGRSADVFSIGCCIFYLITGFNPFDRYESYIVSNILNKKFEIKFDTIDYVKCLKEYQKFHAKDLLQRMLIRDPKQRISLQSALEHPFFWDILKINKFLMKNYNKLENPKKFLYGEYFEEGMYEGLTEFLNNNNPYKIERINTRSSPQSKTNIDGKANNKSDRDFANLIMHEYPSTLIDLYKNQRKQDSPAEEKTYSGSINNRRYSPSSSSEPKAKKQKVDTSYMLTGGHLLRSQYIIEATSY